MEIVHSLTHPFPHLIIENMYNDEELELIWEELEFLNKPEKFNTPENYGAAGNKETGEYLTKSLAIILEDVYVNNRKISNILNIHSKIFKYNQLYFNLSPYHKKIMYINQGITKIRYYCNGDEYLPHSDTLWETLVCTYFNKFPKKFTGGELYFPEYNNYEVSCNHNMSVMFPSQFEHGVRKVNMLDDDSRSGYGRYCMSQCLSINPNLQTEKNS